MRGGRQTPCASRAAAGCICAREKTPARPQLLLRNFCDGGQLWAGDKDTKRVFSPNPRAALPLGGSIRPGLSRTSLAIVDRA